MNRIKLISLVLICLNFQIKLNGSYVGVPTSKFNKSIQICEESKIDKNELKSEMQEISESINLELRNISKINKRRLSVLLKKYYELEAQINEKGE